MAKTSKKVSINKLEKSLHENNTVELPLQGNDDVFFQVKKVLTLDEMRDFVQNVVESCIDDENGEYVAEAYDFAIRVNVFTIYANFTMPTDLGKQYWLMYNTSVYYDILNIIDSPQFNSILRTIDEKIKYRLNIITASLANKINEIIQQLDEFVEIAGSAFSGIDPESMTNVLQNIAKIKDLPENDILKALAGNTENAASAERVIEIVKE